MHRVRLWSFAAVAVLACCAAHAQLSSPNASSVAMGHVHYVVPDVARTAAFWETLGGRRAPFGAGEIVTFPGVAIVLTAGDARPNSEQAIVGHIAFRVASVAAIEARGIDVTYNEQFPGVVYVYTPDGERVELFDDGIATNIGFDPDSADAGAVALRHNAPLSAPIVTHHMHLYVAEADIEPARDWYIEHFGAVAGTRWRYAAADLPGMNLNFSAATQPRAPTRGRMLDHVGFEIAGLADFTAALEARGVEFDMPYTQLESGLSIAFLTDPWGTYIELTEGLRDYE